MQKDTVEKLWRDLEGLSELTEQLSWADKVILNIISEKLAAMASILREEIEADEDGRID